MAFVGGQAINISMLDEAVSRVRERLKSGLGFNFATLNLDHLVKLGGDAQFRAVYDRMTFVSADGAPVAMLARGQARGMRRTTGADLLLPLCQMAALEGIPVALFGSSQHSLDLAAARLRALAPGLKIAHVVSPPFGFRPQSQEAAAYGEAIAASGAKLCFVCLGAPKQEIFSDQLARAHPDIGFVCVGAAADFVSGAQSRAPGLVRAVGMEWAWRLASQPRRMVGRYALCARLLGEMWVADRLAAWPASDSRKLQRSKRRLSMWYNGNGRDAKAAAAGRQD